MDYFFPNFLRKTVIVSLVSLLFIFLFKGKYELPIGMSGVELFSLFHAKMKLDAAKKLYSQGWHSKKEGLYERAEDSFQKAIETCPDFAFAYYGRGKFRYEQELFKQAIFDFNKSIEVDEQQKNFFTELIFEPLGLPKYSIIPENSFLDNAYFYLIKANAQLGDFEGIKSDFEKLETLMNNSPRRIGKLYDLVAFNCLANNLYEDAEFFSLRAIEKGENRSRANLILALILQGNNEDAENLWVKHSNENWDKDITIGEKVFMFLKEFEMGKIKGNDFIIGAKEIKLNANEQDNTESFLGYINKEHSFDFETHKDDDLKTITNSCLQNESTYFKNNSNYITFYNRKGNQYQFTGEVDSSPVRGRVKAQRNEITVLEGNTKGTIDIIRECKEIRGVIQIKNDRGRWESEALDYKLKTN